MRTDSASLLERARLDFTQSDVVPLCRCFERADRPVAAAQEKFPVRGRQAIEDRRGIKLAVSGFFSGSLIENQQPSAKTAFE